MITYRKFVLVKRREGLNRKLEKQSWFRRDRTSSATVVLLDTRLWGDKIKLVGGGGVANYSYGSKENHLKIHEQEYCHNWSCLYMFGYIYWWRNRRRWWRWPEHQGTGLLPSLPWFAGCSECCLSALRPTKLQSIANLRLSTPWNGGAPDLANVSQEFNIHRFNS